MKNGRIRPPLFRRWRYSATPTTATVNSREFANLNRALSAYQQIRKTLVDFVQKQRMDLVAVYARRILTATAQLYGGRLILDQALVAAERLAAGQRSL